MKQILKRILIIATVAVMLFTFVSCGDKSGAVKTAFENEGYEVTSVKYDDLDKSIKGLVESVLVEDQINAMKSFEIILCKKGVASALVIKCGSADDVKSFLTFEKDGEQVTDLYDDAVDNGLINGNCYIITLVPRAIEIFKNA